MRSWTLLLGPMLVWTLHFFSLYILGSVWESTVPARWGTGAMTLLCLALDTWLLAACLSLIRTRPGSSRRWVASVGAVSAVLSLAAVVWQGLPAVLA